MTEKLPSVVLLGIIVKGLKGVTMMCFRGKTDIRGASYRQKGKTTVYKKENFLNIQV
jgi:hypothetical protein